MEQTTENVETTSSTPSSAESAGNVLSPTASEQELANREKVVLKDGRGGLVGVKAGMTQVFNENGDSIAVTVIDLRPNIITDIRTNEKNGYTAVQVGVLPKKPKAAKKSEQGAAKKAGAFGFYLSQEIRLPRNSKLDGVAVGKSLSPEFVKEGDLVDLTAISKGKGFQGGMKRYHMAGGFKSHGASIVHRSIGSIGNRADPGKCFRNKKMPGQMGHEQVTVQNVKVIKIDLENQFMLVNGSVPGPRSGLVTLRKAIKSMPTAVL